MPDRPRNTRRERESSDRIADNIHPKPATADAVAVALAQDPARGDAEGAPPRVVASGRGRVAEQILELAFANNVRVREDADLAQLLSAIEVESEIPIEAFAAVAEILIYVYRANGALGPYGIPANLDPATWRAGTDNHEPGKDTG